MKKIVVFTGAGVSNDSGIATFRDSDGLWANHKIEDICTPQALEHNRDQVIQFYNARRKELFETEPNAGHYAIAQLEKHFDVEVITQNIDDLHERAGSSKITHLHGELRKLRSSKSPDLIFPINEWEQQLDAKASDGSLLRPFIVFFGESVPMFDIAVEIAAKADIMIIVGTSLAVYPAAALVSYIHKSTLVWLVDPNTPDISGIKNKLTHIKHNSVIGLPMLCADLIQREMSTVPL